MKKTEFEWNYAKEDLIRAVTALGLPENLAVLIAKQLGSPKAIRRMTSYLWQAKPRTAEEVVDEMLAIESEIEAWREKKVNEEAFERYNRMLRDEMKVPNFPMSEQRVCDRAGRSDDFICV